jgi:signal transduction histidine kinase
MVRDDDLRVRIAGELHDLVSHQASVAAIQANAAQALLPRDPARAVIALRAIAATTREALDDLRRLQAVLEEPVA